ncbi:MAG: cupin domain-containing protein [Anaerolineae bacterium]|nr:cupin domain-containing protein [Anaerolineae bacterium]
MPQPIIANGTEGGQINASGNSFEIHEWSGGGPDYLHVHYADDEAWHVLEGTLTFRFADGEVEAPQGSTVFVPAGVAHTYYEAHGPTRYLLVLTPRLHQMIAELHATPYNEHGQVLRRFESAIVE